MPHVTIRLKDWSRMPSGRYKRDGPYSGEVFREEILAPALLHNNHVTLDLNGSLGIPSSWIEEVFGGLARVHHLPSSFILERLDLSLNQPLMNAEVMNYIGVD